MVGGLVRRLGSVGRVGRRLGLLLGWVGGWVGESSGRAFDSGEYRQLQWFTMLNKLVGGPLSTRNSPKGPHADLPEFSIQIWSIQPTLA